MGLTKRPKIQGQGHSNHFQTDPSALFPLLPFLDPNWIIWEPAEGKGRLSSWLRMEGFDVIGTDVLTGENFFEYEPFLSMHDAIVTNPPYSIKNGWLERCYDLGKPFALLLPYTAMEGHKRQALYRRFGVDTLYLKNRVKFTTPSGKKGGAWFPVMWLTWKLLPERIMFEE